VIPYNQVLLQLSAEGNKKLNSFQDVEDTSFFDINKRLESIIEESISSY